MSTRAWCSHCGDDCLAIRDPDKGYLCCTECGKVLHQDMYQAGPTFEKTAGGQARLSGSIMHSVQSGYSVSRERTLMRGRDEISYMVSSLNVGGGDSIINRAHAFYQIAVERNFTRGRRTSHVAAACLYIACRQTKKAYLLIDFSDYLQINVYVLGAVFLQLCKGLNLWEHPIVQKLVDPSLFIHRFTERLLGEKNNAVSGTALRIIASMKRDWMQTGRKPSGLCGAAIYIAALSHGLNYSKSDIVTVVHVCEATLTKRLIEFENTESGCLTIEEFLSKADELDGEIIKTQVPTPGQLLCKHKDGKEPHFAHGLCEKCYKKFVKISGGLDGSAEPPAFQRAERQRKELAKAENTKESCLDAPPKPGSGNGQEEDILPSKDSTDAIPNESPVTKEPECAGDAAADAAACDESQDLNNEAADESDNFSDIDDAEVDGYLHNEEEKHYKKIIWEEMNKEYLQEQEAKEAAAAVARKAHEAFLANSSEDVLSAHELAAATAAALAKSRKEKRHKRAEEARNTAPPQTPLDATRQMLKRKTFSSRVNYEALQQLFTTDHDGGKKQRVESDNNGDANAHHTTEQDSKECDLEARDDAADASTLGDSFGAEEVVYDDYYGNEDDEYTNGEAFDFEEI